MRLRHLPILALLALVGQGLAQECERWHTVEFFTSATPEEVTACLEAGADVNGWTGNGWTPLHFAAGNTDNPAVIRVLIEAGAGVDARDWFESTPLHWAARSNYSAVIEALLDAGADRSARDLSEKTPWDYARDRPVFADTATLQRLTPGSVGRATSMKIGLLLNFSGSPETAADRKRAFDLAIQHINDAGGVLGRRVESVWADATLDPNRAVEEAWRLVEAEGIHALVGPNASAAALPVAETVAGPARITTISQSATSPQLTVADDDDYFFRVALSDVAQGPVLARVTRERGFDSVGLIYRDDPYGQGLAASFEAAWGGTVRSAPIEAEQESYLPELQETASAGAQALVVVTFEAQALAVVREAIREGIYDQFVFGDAAKRLGLVAAIGGGRLGGMYGTAGAPAPDGDATAEWDEAFEAAYGRLPVLTYVKETYDATVALAFAAQAAGSLDGAAIRNQLRAVGGAPGEIVLGTPVGVANGLRLLAEGREIDFDGAATSMDWDENGDLRRGYIGIWRFTEDERIEELETVLFVF